MSGLQMTELELGADAVTTMADVTQAPRVMARRKVRVLFINDTARNGGPGRSLFYILRFLDPAVIHRAVVLPRRGVISDLYESRGVTDELFFERGLVENMVEPWSRPIDLLSCRCSRGFEREGAAAEGWPTPSMRSGAAPRSSRGPERPGVADHR